ncbi:MAG: HEPN domain-containing protein [Chloroflexota bacterium]
MGERFLRQAERDLEFAQTLLVPRGYDLVANLAHQATEKALNWVAGAGE